jgi:hypothetical protein
VHVLSAQFSLVESESVDTNLGNISFEVSNCSCQLLTHLWGCLHDGGRMYLTFTQFVIHFLTQFLVDNYFFSSPHGNGVISLVFG